MGGNQDFLEQFHDYYKQYILKNETDILIELLNQSDQNKFYDYNFNLSQALNQWPQIYQFFKDKLIIDLIGIIKESVIEAQDHILNKQKIKQGFVKDRLNINMQYIPALKYFYIKTISDLSPSNILNLILVQGTVIRTGEIKSIVVEQQIKCNQCGQIQTIYGDPTDYHRLQPPITCNNVVKKPINPWFQMMRAKKFNKQGKPIMKNTVQKPCGSKKFQPLEGTEHLIDCQEIKIQDLFQQQNDKNGKHTLDIILYGQMVNQCKAGDSIVCGGILYTRWSKINIGNRPDIQLVLNSFSIQVSELNSQLFKQKISKSQSQISTQSTRINYSISSPKDIQLQEIIHRNKLIKSTCPSLFKNYDLKLAILLSLVGGSRVQNSDSLIRSNSHLLLIGEPGTGKSSILRYVSNMSQRSVFVNGIGLTSAGLTVSYVKENGNWMIEAGALALADQGVCCIDEFNLVQRQQLESVLEALEQQTISSSKAGLTSKLDARCTVVAACNPISVNQKYFKYDKITDISTNTGLSYPILSRFDLIFLLEDPVVLESDMENSRFILNKYMCQQQKYTSLYNQCDQIYTSEELVQLLDHSRQSFEPQVSIEAKNLITQYYVRLRKTYSHITIRSLESIIRLSQAHAKLMQRNNVDVFDVASVLIVCENSGCQTIGQKKTLDQEDSIHEIYDQIQNFLINYL